MSAPGSHMLGLVELADIPPQSEFNEEQFQDMLLEAFESRLNDWIRPKDQCHSLPDNRMCVVLNSIKSPGEFELATAKLERMFAEPHYHQGEPIALNIKAGFAPYDEGSDGMSTAMRNATLALGRAKDSIHLYEIYSAVKADDKRFQNELLEEMRAALERGEFHLYYQPKVNAAYRNLVGAEALIRWHTRTGDVKHPDEFIGLAETDALIKPLTWWVIKSAVGRLARWPEDMSIAVNISPVLLLDEEIESVVLDALDIYSVSAERLTLEVTEQIMIEDQTSMLETLARLRTNGVKIAIDDFGTGFSSLVYFRDLPADEIKIDKSFVQHMLHSEKDLAIVKAVIDLAHNFSLKVVAEGVESNEIAEKLLQMNCDILQGYAYDEPLPVEEFEISYRLR